MDRTDSDIRIRYRQRYSFPKKFLSIQIEFPDGRVRTSLDEIDCIADDLVSAFVDSREFEKACRRMYWLSEDSKNIASELEVSYVLAERCGKHGKPGVIIYWEK